MSSQTTNEISDESSLSTVGDSVVELKNSETPENLLSKALAVQLATQDYKNEIERLKKDVFKKIEQVTDSADLKIKELKDDQINVIQALSIFVAFFTFVSIEFKVLTTGTNILEVAGFTLILLGSLIIFTLLVDFVLTNKLPINKAVKHTRPRTLSSLFSYSLSKNEEDEFKWRDSSTWGVGMKVKYIPLFILCILLLVFGIGLIVLSHFNKETTSQISTSTATSSSVNVQINGPTQTILEPTESILYTTSTVATTSPDVN